MSLEVFKNLLSYMWSWMTTLLSLPFYIEGVTWGEFFAGLVIFSLIFKGLSVITGLQFDGFVTGKINHEHMQRERQERFKSKNDE